MSFYKRHLPHWHPRGAKYFVTFRLAGSLPKVAVEKLKASREILNQEIAENLTKGNGSDKLSDLHKRKRLLLKKYEDLLDSPETGPTWLKEEKIANIVREALHHRDKVKYNLFAYCIMPNHVHVVFELFEDLENSNKSETEYPLAKLLHSLKSYTALECNKLLSRTGAFWQPESYDRVIRDSEELEKTVKYTLNNPVKAGIIEDWKDWPYSYCKPAFLESI